MRKPIKNKEQRKNAPTVELRKVPWIKQLVSWKPKQQHGSRDSISPAKWTKASCFKYYIENPTKKGFLETSKIWVEAEQTAQQSVPSMKQRNLGELTALSSNTSRAQQRTRSLKRAKLVLITEQAARHQSIPPNKMNQDHTRCAKHYTESPHKTLLQNKEFF